MTHQKIDRWVWMFSGYAQNLRAGCGIEDLFFALRELEGAGTMVEFDQWDADADGIAAVIARRSGDDPDIILIGYSYGGWKAIKVCQALKRRGIRVRCLILCDAVYRTDWQPEWTARHGVALNPLSLLPLSKMKVPDNVGEVIWFYQRNKLPKGHPVIAENPKLTVINAGIQLRDRTHATIDEAPELYLAAVRAINHHIRSNA